MPLLDAFDLNALLWKEAAKKRQELQEQLSKELAQHQQTRRELEAEQIRHQQTRELLLQLRLAPGQAQLIQQRAPAQAWEICPSCAGLVEFLEDRSCPVCGAPEATRRDS